MRKIALVALLASGCGGSAITNLSQGSPAQPFHKAEYVRPSAPVPPTSSPTTTVPEARPRRKVARSAPARVSATRTGAPSPTRTTPRPAVSSSTGGRRVSSTAYCLTGTMANGQRAARGYVAMNGVPMGSRWQVVETGATYTVGDRIGHSSQFDIAMPGDCAAARAYGRRTIHVRRVG